MKFEMKELSISLASSNKHEAVMNEECTACTSCTGCTGCTGCTNCSWCTSATCVHTGTLKCEPGASASHSVLTALKMQLTETLNKPNQDKTLTTRLI